MKLFKKINKNTKEISIAKNAFSIVGVLYLVVFMIWAWYDFIFNGAGINGINFRLFEAGVLVFWLSYLYYKKKILKGMRF